MLMSGGALGTIARYALSGLTHRITGPVFPWGTLLVNLTGSFIIGIVWAMGEDSAMPSYMRTFLFIGFFGGFTTFSTFSLETMNLMRDNEYQLAAINILANNVFGILLVFGGYLLTRSLISLMK